MFECFILIQLKCYSLYYVTLIPPPENEPFKVQPLADLETPRYQQDVLRFIVTHYFNTPLPYYFHQIRIHNNPPCVDLTLNPWDTS